MKGPEAEKLLDQMAARLGEQFDCVQIMVSWNEDGQTFGLKRGNGNWYARQGMAHEFIQQDIAVEHAEKLAAKLEPPPDSGESWKKE